VTFGSEFIREVGLVNLICAETARAEVEAVILFVWYFTWCAILACAALPLMSGRHHSRVKFADAWSACIRKGHRGLWIIAFTWPAILSIRSLKIGVTHPTVAQTFIDLLTTASLGLVALSQGRDLIRESTRWKAIVFVPATVLGASSVYRVLNLLWYEILVAVAGWEVAIGWHRPVRPWPIDWVGRIWHRLL